MSARRVTVLRRAALGVITALLAVTAVSVVRSTAAAEVKLGTPAPELAGGPWINSEPLTLASLRGRVTLVEFWTYG